MKTNYILKTLKYAKAKKKMEMEMKMGDEGKSFNECSRIYTRTELQVRGIFAIWQCWYKNLSGVVITKNGLQKTT